MRRDSTGSVFKVNERELVWWNTMNERSRVEYRLSHLPDICRECGDDEVCEGYAYCSDCLPKS